MPNSNSERRIDALIAGLCAAIFAALHLVSASAHTLHPDAADMLYPIVGLLKGVPELLRHSVCLRILGVDVPLSFHPYHGPFEGYISLPFLAVFGNTGWAAYLRSTAFGVLSVFGVYALALRLHRERRVAALAAVLWGGSSGFVIVSRAGINLGTSVIAMCLFALYCFVDWLERPRSSRLLAGCAVLGLACGTRAWCFAFPIALALAALAARESVGRAWRASSGRPALAVQCGLVFTVWLLPLVLGNVLGGWQTIGFFRQGWETGSSLLRSFHWTEAFSERVWGLRAVLDGTRWIGLFTSDDRLPAGSPMPYFAAAACVAAILASVMRAARRQSVPKRHLLPVVLFAGYFAAALGSPTNRVPNHFYPVLPLLYISLASAPLLFDPGRARRAAWAAVLIAVGWTLSADLRILRWFWSEVERTGGRGVETSLVVEDLTRWLDEPGHREPIVTSAANFSGTLLYLSAGRVAPASPYWGPDAAKPFDSVWWDEALSRPGELFIFDRDPPRHWATFEYMNKAARRAGLRLEKVRSFDRRDGTVVFEAYRAL